MTILEAIQKGAAFLGDKGVESPRLQTELLLAHLVGMPRMSLYLSFERTLNPDEITRFRELIRRRAAREPLQHIVGSVDFCGTELAVSVAALVPRPETELLAELGRDFLRSREGTGSTCLDLGTGSGCLAIALAVSDPHVQVWASDISQEALRLAQTNAERHGLTSRIRFLLGDLFQPLPSGVQFDLIITNPPYIPTRDIQTLQAEVRDHDPKQALDGGEDGLDLFRAIAGEASSYLRSDGRLMTEIGLGQTPDVCSVFEAQKWVVDRLVEDYNHVQRFLIVRLSD